MTEEAKKSITRSIQLTLFRKGNFRALYPKVSLFGYKGKEIVDVINNIPLNFTVDIIELRSNYEVGIY